MGAAAVDSVYAFNHNVLIVIRYPPPTHPPPPLPLPPRRDYTYVDRLSTQVELDVQAKKDVRSLKSFFEDRSREVEAASKAASMFKSKLRKSENVFAPKG